MTDWNKLRPPALPMAGMLLSHIITRTGHCSCGSYLPDVDPKSIANHVAEALAENGFGSKHEAWEEGQKAGVTNQCNWDGWRHEPAAIENPYPKVDES